MKNKILAFGYHDQKAPRHGNICKELKKEGSEIIECHTTKKGLFGKYSDLHKKYRGSKKEIDTVYVTFPGTFLMPLAWFLTRFPRKRLVFDAFISLYDTLVLDRKKVSRLNPYAWFLFFMDFVTCHLADEIIVDTKEHGKLFNKTFKVNPKKIKVIYVGSRKDLFFPTPQSPLPNPKFEVFFYGSYIPLQGIEHIIHAADHLRSNDDIHFTLLGGGQTYDEMRKLADQLNVTNITFKKFVPLEELPDLIRASDLCLGIFGTTEKTRRVIPHKVFDSLACGIPVLTADTPAIRELYENDANVTLCEAGNPEAIVEKILEIKAKNS